MAKRFEHMGHPNVRFPYGYFVNRVHVLKNVIKPDSIIAGNFFKLPELIREFPTYSMINT
jgi:hypothetical protein